MKKTSLKLKIYGLLTVYTLAWFAQSWMPFFQSDIFANARKANINIVALMVDKNLYNGSLKNSIDRYATNYIQQKISNSRAVIFPIDTNNIKARDITKMLENIYYDGIEKEPSMLKGVILIGDKVPLPVVNDNGTIFPTIFPYTDFDNPKYYWDPNIQFFVPNNVPKAQAEIRQSMINIGTQSEDYIAFFEKLKQYNANPTAYIGNKVWYDDFIDQQSSFNKTNLPNYINKFLFAEDFAYHRYNPVVLDFFNRKNNIRTQNLTQSLSNLTGESGSYANQIWSVFSWLLVDYKSNSGWTENNTTPTVFVDDALKGFQKPYQDLYGVSSTSRMRDNVLSAGRRDTSQIDSHASKIEYYDQLYTKQLWESRVPFFVELNKQLEDKIIAIVKQKQYPLRISIPVNGTIEKHVYTKLWSGISLSQAYINSFTNTFINTSKIIKNPASHYYKAGIYEAFYYGKNASTITWIDQTSIFLGTPNPINNDIANIWLITGIDTTRGIWSSYGILSQFVEANRWYAADKTIIDEDREKFNAGVCNKNFPNFRDVYLWGNTPLNLTGEGLELPNKRYDRGGIANWIVTNFASLWEQSLLQAGSIFNIAWSKKVITPEAWMFAQNMQGGFLQRVVFEDIVSNWFFGFGTTRRRVRKRVDTCDARQTESEPLTAHDISTTTWLYQTGYFKQLKINGQTLITSAVSCPNTPITWSTCFPYEDKPAIPAEEYLQRQELNYKIIDSLSVHNAPNPDQISQFTKTTLDRPIDSIRYLSFKWIGGDRVKFEFPNLYNIPIYKIDPKSSWSLMLQSPIEIQQSIRKYLQNIVIEYNNSITNQINKQPNYFNSNNILFTRLGLVDPLATPARPYTLIDTNILNNSINDEIVSTIAQILYTENSLLPKKTVTATLSEELDQIEAISSITNKKKHIIESYITKKTPITPLSFPWYQDKWYELISLTSNGDDSITTSQEPDTVRWAQSLIDDYTAYQVEFNNDQYGTQLQNALKDACASKYGEPVPLVNLWNMSFPWFDMLACRLARIGTPKVTFDFKNAQGPVLTDWFFKDFVSDLGANPYSVSDNALTTSQLTSKEKEIIDAIPINISPKSYLLDPSTPISLQPQITIERKNENIGNLTISFLSTGNNCIIIKNNNLCNQWYTINLWSDQSSFVLPINLQTKKSWYSDLIIKVCKSHTTTCVTQTYSINIVPSIVRTIDITTPYDNILAASPVPVILQAKDEYNNIIPFSLLPYTLTTSTWTFSSGRSTVVSDFREIQELQWPIWSWLLSSNVTITDKKNTLISSKQVVFAPGKVKITAEDSYFSDNKNTITYTLPKKKSLVYINKEYTNIGLLPKLTLRLTNKLNGETLAWPIIIKSERWTFDMYKIDWFSNNIVANTWLELTNTIIFNGEKEHIIIKPKGNSSTDNLVLIYPDWSEEKIQVNILASLSATQVKIVPDNTIDNNLLPNNSSLQAQLYVYDDRWNLVTTPTLVKSESYWSLSFSGTTTKTTLIPAWWSTSLSLQTENNGGAWYIVSKIVSDNATIPWLWKTKVEESIIPKWNINGLYINIMGTSRWDITSNNNDKYNFIPNLFKSSEKLLVSTTQISDPNKLNTSILQVLNNWTTQGKEINNRMIIQRKGELIAQNIVSQSEVYIWKTNNFSRSNNINESSIIYPNNTNIIAIFSWSAWSTNSEKIITLIDRTSTYKPNKVSSIEDAIDPNKNIGWRNNQEHLTQFGQGKSVWESTMINASEFLINYGDPLITRLSNNTTLSWANLDDGPGQTIVNDPSRTIVKSLSIDINNDGLKDIVTIFSDGEVIWSKQYGGKQIFIEMWPLLKIFGTINNVFGVNAQWDGFDDIMVEGEDKTLRIYTNKLWVFDVDGFPVCINTQETPANSLENIDQWFVDDMDNDGLSDIITNQEGQVRIIYGWAVANGYSYISQYHDSCDQNWQSRQSRSVKTIETLATQISDWNTVDSSLLRWSGLIQNTDSISEDGNIEDTTINSNLENQIKKALQSPIPNFNALPLQEITNQASANLMRRSVSPIDYMPVYETVPSEDIRYITTSQLTTQDQVRVYKKYEDLNGGILKKNDTVKVTVSILGLRNNLMTYLDRIQWPWIVKMDNNGLISWRNNGTLPTNAFYKSLTPQWGFMFAVDNITLWANNATEFSYLLTYQWWASTKIKIADRNNDEYKDISVYPLDGCSKFLRTFINNKSIFRNYRDYDKSFIDLEQRLTDYDTTTQQNSQNYISGMTNAIQNITWATGPNSDIINSILNNAWSESMVLWNFLTNSLQEWWNSINLNLASINNVANDINNKVRDALQELCGGGKDWWENCGSWLPIPFNMAFLSPGQFNIMWCKPRAPIIPWVFPKDNWFPVFAFPAYTPPAPPIPPLPLPFPFGWIHRGAGDTYWYYWFPLPEMGPWSFIRIYLSPTLTQQMGMAICMWPQGVWLKLPPPLNAMWGNCIVTKVNMPTASCTNNDPNGAWNLSDQDLLDLSEFGTCTQWKAVQINSRGDVLPQSPFKLVSYNNGTMWNPFPPGNYFGIINFEKTPIVLGEDSNNEWVVLQWWKAVQPKVQWAKPKWLVACIVGGWLDRQTNYIINNFTNMQIGVYLPDLSQIGEWFENLGDQLNDAENNTGSINNFFNNFWSSWDGINNNIDTFSGNLMQTVRNYTINQSSLQELSDGVNNPFDQLAKMFEQTPIVRINTVDVPVNIPMIYAEDIAKYESYLKTRTERNKQILKDWETILQGTLGICGKNYDLLSNSKNNISQPPVISKEFFKQLYKKLKDEKEQLKEKTQKKKELYKEFKSCKAEKRNKDDPSCMKIMNTFSINEKWLWEIELKIDQWEKINDQCLNLFFDINWALNVNFENLFSIMTKFSALENNIKINIKTLDQYKRFPLQLYQWIHVVDRYLSEITTTVDNFLWSLTLWLHTNATRFEQYVDAIITISTALQTRQAILDLSIDRQKKCSSCTVDNYDAYACSLSFLCGKIQLPILKLPPFKIPNIYIDLSHIDIGMDINLPKFQFTPTSVPLVELPNLPQPPSIVINADISAVGLEKVSTLLGKLLIAIGIQIPLSLPTIPLLPSPPTLPELPSFIPNINVELPVLPPAPKIPKIAPEINTVIKAVSFFSELYCIVKWGVWLVGESNVKTRIEQLTQRTYEIPLFDNINLSKDMSYQQDKLQWFDFQIDAYVNFTMNFNGVYTLIKWLADTINDQTKKLTEREGDAKQALNKINENAQDLNDTTQQNITIGNPLWFVENNSTASVSDEQKNITKVAQFLIDDDRTPLAQKEKITWLSQRLEQKTRFTPQKENILALQQKINGSITSSRQSLQSLQNQVKDYDNFLGQLSEDKNYDYSLYSGTHTFSTNLFDGDTKILKQNNNNIMKDYIGLQKTLLSHYKKWLTQVINNDNKDVVNKINNDILYLEQWLTLTEDLYTNQQQPKTRLVALQNTYDASQNLIYNNQAATCSSLWNLAPTNSTTTLAQTNTYPYFWATAQIGWTSATSTTSNSTTNNLYDFSAYKNKLMLPFPNTSGTGSTYVNVVRSDYFTNNNKWYELIDINDDKEKDLLRRDTKSVWIKYGKQNTSHVLSLTNTTTNKYVAPVWNTTDQRKEDTNDGYLSINNIKLKVYNRDRSVKNLRVRAQDYDSFTVSWTNSDRQQPVEWYLLEINKIPDLYHIKWHNDVSRDLKSRYVLFVPEWKDTTDGYLTIKDQLTTTSFSDLLTGTLLDIVSYKTTNNTISYSFLDIPRAWYYTRIVSLQMQWDEDKPVYMPSSPRSHHIVAGQQIIADTQWPSPDIQLQRIMTNTIVDTGLSPQWLVNTRYNMLIEREDPNGVIENWIETSTGKIISQISGNTNILSGLYFNQNIIQNYRIGARDNNNNISREQLNLTINIPTISLDDIIYENTPTNGINILSSITQGMDDGIVKFERKRNNVRTLLSNNAISDWWFNYPLVLNQTFVTGWLYNQSQNISFFAPNGTIIASMNKENGSISITPEYISRINKKVDLKSNTPIITLYDSVENRNLFTIKPNTSNPQLTAISPYKIMSLSGALYGSFAWGTCIVWPENNCIVIAAPNGFVVIPSPYHTSLIGNYGYTNNVTNINFTNPTWLSVWSVSFNAFIK